MLGSRDAKFRAKLNALLGEKRDQISQFIEYFYKRTGTPPPVAPPLMALGFMSLIEGVKLFELSSPSDMTPQAAQAILAMFMDSVINTLPPPA
jgi:AcrR family transcriptional regulator